MARRNLLKGFKRPKGITFEHSELEPDYGKFIAYPFERGYGVTMGNTLRRILLSSIQGYAISAIRITSYKEDGTAVTITNEFDSIPEVVEDTPDIINNLKQVQFKLQNGIEEKVFTISAKGAKKITAGALEVYNEIEVINKDHHIATLTKKANIEFEIQVDLGRGYVPAERSERYIEIIGTIPMDAVFSPIIKVKYNIENTRVGQRTDYDKLIIEIFTDGSMEPKDTILYAANILQRHLDPIISIGSLPEINQHSAESYMAHPVGVPIILPEV